MLQLITKWNTYCLIQPQIDHSFFPQTEYISFGCPGTIHNKLLCIWDVHKD